MGKHSLYQEKDFQVASFGGFGLRFYSGTDVQVANEIYHVIEATAATTFTTLDNSAGGDTDIKAEVTVRGALCREARGTRHAALEPVATVDGTLPRSIEFLRLEIARGDYER